jgi:four helix bundle protein
MRYWLGMHNHENPRIYHAGLDLAEEAYVVAHKLPTFERYGRASQMRRASVTIPSNIAEGAGRGSSRDFARFLRIAIGSECEVGAHIDLAVRLHSLAQSDARAVKDRVRTLIKQINALERQLQNKP